MVLELKSLIVSVIFSLKVSYFDISLVKCQLRLPYFSNQTHLMLPDAPACLLLENPGMPD